MLFILESAYKKLTHGYIRDTDGTIHVCLCACRTHIEMGLVFSALLLSRVLFTLITKGRKGVSWVVSPSATIHSAAG